MTAITPLTTGYHEITPLRKVRQVITTPPVTKYRSLDKKTDLLRILRKNTRLDEIRDGN